MIDTLVDNHADMAADVDAHSGETECKEGFQMRTHTVEVTWRVSEYAHLIVKAETPEAAMAKALECSQSGLPSKSNRAEDQDGDIQILKDPEYDYESNLGRDRVTGIS